MATQKVKSLIKQDIYKQAWCEIYNTNDVNEKVERYQQILNRIFTTHHSKKNVKLKSGKPLLENSKTIKLSNKRTANTKARQPKMRTLCNQHQKSTPRIQELTARCEADHRP